MNLHIHMPVCVYSINIKCTCSVITITVFRYICIEVCMTVYKIKYAIIKICEIGFEKLFLELS